MPGQRSGPPSYVSSPPSYASRPPSYASRPPSYVSRPPSYASRPPYYNEATYSSSGPSTQPVYPGHPAHPGSRSTQTAYPGVAPTLTVSTPQSRAVNTNNTVVVQPATGTPVISSYLEWSICSSIFCFCPLGLVAIIFSCISRGHAKSGRFAGARQNGQIALWLNLTSLLLGPVLIYVWVFIHLDNQANDDASDDDW